LSIENGLKLIKQNLQKSTDKQIFDTFSIENGLKLKDALSPPFSSCLSNVPLWRSMQTKRDLEWTGDVSFWHV